MTGGPVTIKLQNAPGTGQVIKIKDIAGLAATSNITLTTVGGAVLIDGATSVAMNSAYQSTNLIFSSTAYYIY